MTAYNRILLLTPIVCAAAACTHSQLVHVATSNDPQTAVRHLLEHRERAYRSNPALFLQDAGRARRNLQQLLAALRGNVSRHWGRAATLVASRHRYVKYTHNYKSRAIVNFDSGKIQVETVAHQNAGHHLEKAIVTTLLIPDDPRAADLYSDNAVRLSAKPYLYGLVRDHRGRSIQTPQGASNYARFLRTNRMTTRHTAGRTVTYVKFHMVDDHLDHRARRYAPLVSYYARVYELSENLVFAIIKTESSLNPFAVSAAPAYGLMQLVPTSGGRDAYRAVRNRDGIPSPAYLFNPKNNIELGTAYLGLIKYRYLARIRNPTAREYCTIAAYNGGSGTVLRVFDADRDRAIDTLNTMSPGAVYKALRTGLGNRETRRYLHKVVRARRAFVRI